MTRRKRPPAPARRPGGRAAAVVAAVHQAATALLAEVGYDALQLPDVAAHAGVNKTTVYRRWSTKADLVSDLLLEASSHEWPGSDTGNLLDDLLAMLTDITDLLHIPAMQALLRASLAGEVDPTARENFWAERMRRSAVIIDRAIRRGDLPPTTDARLLLEHAASTIYFRLLVTGEPVDHADLRMFAQRAITAAQSI